MGPFLLIFLTLDAQTGSPLSSAIIGDPYPSIEGCIRAAIDQGPQKSVDGKASLVYCQAAGSRYTLTVKPPEEPRRDG
jgi:hypothetical protein